MPAHYTNSKSIQLVSYHTFADAIAFNAQPTPFADWVAMIAQGTIFAKTNVVTTTANYAAMVQKYRDLMALGAANFYNLTTSVPGFFTTIGTLNQYPQVQTALTDPGAFAPYVWDAGTRRVGCKEKSQQCKQHARLSMTRIFAS